MKIKQSSNRRTLLTFISSRVKHATSVLVGSRPVRPANQMSELVPLREPDDHQDDHPDVRLMIILMSACRNEKQTQSETFYCSRVHVQTSR